MAENTILTAEDEKSINFNGLTVDMAAAIGDIFAKRFISELSEKDYEKIEEFMIKEVFNGFNYRYKDCKTDKEKRECIAEYGKFGDIKDSSEKSGYGFSGGYSNNGRSIPNWARDKVNNAFKDMITKKIEELVQTEEFKERADEAAQEILDYAVDGWKKDAKCRIRMRMIDDPLDKTYYGVSIKQIITEEVDKIIQSSRNY